MKTIIQNRKTFLYIILSCVFLTNAIIAEIIGVKIISLEAILGVPPVNLQLAESIVLNFNLTAGVIIWPLVFVITDIINEYYGTDGVKKISYLAFLLIAYVFLVIWVTTKVPPAAFWSPKNAGFVEIFTQGMNIIIASLIAFLLSQLLDAYVFKYIRSMTGSKRIWLRATCSTLVSQLADSFVVIILAFYLLETPEKRWTWSQILSVCVSNYIFKFGVALLMIPMLYIIHYWIDSYLGLKESEQLQKVAEEQ